MDILNKPIPCNGDACHLLAHPKWTQLLPGCFLTPLTRLTCEAAILFISPACPRGVSIKTGGSIPKGVLVRGGGEEWEELFAQLGMGFDTVRHFTPGASLLAKDQS